MIPGPDAIFSLPEILALVEDELALLPACAARQPAGRALLLQPSAAARAIAADARQLALTRLHADGEMLRGDVACAPGALPFEDEAFQLVVAQHVGDALPAGSGIVPEIARVMAPGSVLLWFGLNPWSPYLVWMHWHARRGAQPQTSHADALRRRLSRLQLATVALDYRGAAWPRLRDGADSDAAPSTPAWLARLRGTYVLTARKQRAVLTPLRRETPRKAVALGSRLAGTPTTRACA